jgi:hypothetical protein
VRVRVQVQMRVQVRVRVPPRIAATLLVAVSPFLVC